MDDIIKNQIITFKIVLMIKTTETTSLYRHLDKMSTFELITAINAEDRKVPEAIGKILPDIERCIDAAYERMKEGGRLFYIGAGTSGRLGIVDASECPPTFGVSADIVIGVMAGGDEAIRKSVEHAEDDPDLAWKDLKGFYIDDRDFVIGIAASGTTPYVVHGLKDCRSHGIATGCITCNHGSPLADQADFPIVVVVGPEFVTGSTRMKSGTAQKLILNMISTSIMIKLGRVVDNKMVDMQLSNAKLKDRGTKMVMAETGLSYEKAHETLLLKGSVREAVEAIKKNE